MLGGLSGIVGRRSQKEAASSPTTSNHSSNLTISPPSNPTRGSIPIQQQQQKQRQQQQYTHPHHHQSNNSIHSTTTTSPTSPSRSYHPMLPEELTARERLREREREKERDRERERFERQSQSSNGNGNGGNSTSNPTTTANPRSNTTNPNTAAYSSNHMESSVTRLLVATKLLLESLTKWSLGQRSETQVSDIYVRLGNDFNTARIAFGSYGIDMSDLLSVPDDLRVCLERCLSEEASPQILEVHLPRIREIIINLLQGLKLKQAQYKQFLLQQRNDRRRESVLSSSGGGAGGSSNLNREGSLLNQRRTNNPEDLNRETSSNYKRSSRSTRQGLSENKDLGSSLINSTTEAIEPNFNSRPDSLQRGTSNGVLPTSISSATVRPGSHTTTYDPSLSSNRDSRKPIAPPRLEEDPHTTTSSQRTSGSVGRSSGAGIVRPPSRTKSSGSNHERASQIQNESLNEELPNRSSNGGSGSNSLKRGGNGSIRSNYSDRESSKRKESLSSIPPKQEEDLPSSSRFASSEDEVEDQVVKSQEEGEQTNNNRIPDNIVRHSLIDDGPSRDPEDSNPNVTVEPSSDTVIESPRRSSTSGSKPPPSSASKARKVQELNSSNSLSNLPSSSSSSNSLALPRDPTSPSTSLNVDSDPSLRALKSRDALERRASKRFSAYTFNKMGIGSGFAQIGMSSLSGNSSVGGTPTHGNPTGSPILDSNKKMSSSTSPVESRSSVRKGRSSGNNLMSGLGDTSIGDYNSPARSVAIRRGLEGEGLGSLDESPNLGSLSSPNQSRNGSRASSFSGKKSPGKNFRNLPKENNNDTYDSLTAPELGRKGSTTSSDHSGNFVDANEGEDRIEDLGRSSAANQDETEELGGDEQEEGENEKIPPVPPLPTSEERERLDLIQNSKLRPTSSSSSSNDGGVTSNLASRKNSSLLLPSTPNTSQRISSTSRKTQMNDHPTSIKGEQQQVTVFLQLGRQTKKSVLDLGNSDLSIVRLRMLFIDKFAYSPGMDDFPTICIKHVESGVAYELEDLDDVVDGTVLTLNIEPLDQVKQHLDLSLGVITRELRDLKATVNERRSSKNFSTEALTAAAAAAVQAQVQALGLGSQSVNAPPKISDSQFAAAGQRVAQLKRVNTSRSPSGTGGPEEEPSTIHSPALSSTSITSSSAGAAGAKVASELKSQYDEVQSLRREFAILKQIQDDFGSDISSIIKGVREQSSKVRAIAASEIPAERNFIIAGKSRLDSGSQEVLTLVEDLQDTVDDLKLDVIQRGVKPKVSLMKSISNDILKATKGLEDLETYVRTVKPSWKKTWENELQNIVDEQEFLNHQESLLADLRDDNDALQEVFQNIQQVVKLRGPVKSNSSLNGLDGNGINGGGQSGGNPLAGITLQRYIPPPPEEGHEGLDTVMLEVRSQSVDHEKRLRALQAAERLRAKELASKSDEFQDELKGFVDKKALRKTGGHLEAERVRQRRDKATINAMFGGGGSGGAPPPSNPNGAGNAIEKPKKFILGKDKGNHQKEDLPPSRGDLEIEQDQLQ